MYYGNSIQDSTMGNQQETKGRRNFLVGSSETTREATISIFNFQ